ncbi:hypothetical protein FJ651_11525 [Paucihalobacter ruber]|uniref:Letm1 RBD domain-containing protein n=1 Tax=Paucihalobacter ruber TaxID=2567861 RepID=A0A506PGF9_9FLAO|nr:LETM1-related biofilm-associated protein [Paucihalobacter ruber]TPV32926.1 hypothetical protein FJ651_11525 [Paucihalobacter ruber]
MNPSANGWIKVLLNKTHKYKNIWSLAPEVFYNKLRETGFIYGSNLSIIADDFDTKDFSEEEKCKVNLWFAYYYFYNNFNRSNETFEASVIKFYSNEKPKSYRSFFGFSQHSNASGELEKLIEKRIHIDDNFITKNFKYFIVNALLFIDLLAYKQFLSGQTKTNTYIENFESVVEKIVFMVLDLKPEKSEYDQSLMKLFEASLSYHNQKELSYTQALTHITETLEKQYILDVACMASWGDTKIDISESKFLEQLQIDLNLDKSILESAVNHINYFYVSYKNEIGFLNSKNLVQSFYDNSSKLVAKLIRRNGKRLQKELRDSKEVVGLLSQSTKRKLTDEEQKKVQTQLLDIFKSIPSLAIFMLPGGMLLLPLVIKLIPTLLPSAFDDNRIDN